MNSKECIEIRFYAYKVIHWFCITQCWLGPWKFWSRQIKYWPPPCKRSAQCICLANLFIKCWSNLFYLKWTGSKLVSCDPSYKFVSAQAHWLSSLPRRPLPHQDGKKHSRRSAGLRMKQTWNRLVNRQTFSRVFIPRLHQEALSPCEQHKLEF